MDKARVDEALKTARVVDLVVELPEEPFPKLLARCQLASTLPYFSDITDQKAAPKYARFFIVDFGLRRWDYETAKEHLPELKRLVPGIRPGYVRELLILAHQHPNAFKEDRTTVAHGSISDPADFDFQVPAIVRETDGLHLGLVDGGTIHGGYEALLYVLPLEKKP